MRIVHRVANNMAFHMAICGASDSETTTRPTLVIYSPGPGPSWRRDLLVSPECYNAGGGTLTERRVRVLLSLSCFRLPQHLRDPAFLACHPSFPRQRPYRGASPAWLFARFCQSGRRSLGRAFGELPTRPSVPPQQRPSPSKSLTNRKAASRKAAYHRLIPKMIGFMEAVEYVSGAYFKVFGSMPMIRENSLTAVPTFLW